MVPDRWLPNSCSSSKATNWPISAGISPVKPHRHIQSLRRVVREHSCVGIGPVSPGVNYSKYYQGSKIFYSVLCCFLRFLEWMVLSWFSFYLSLLVIEQGKSGLALIVLPVMVANSTIRSCVSCCNCSGSWPTMLLLLMTIEWTWERSTPTYRGRQERKGEGG